MTDESHDSMFHINGSFLPGAGDMSVSVSSLHSLPGISPGISEAPPTPPSPIDHEITPETTHYLPGDSICSFDITDSARSIDNQYPRDHDGAFMLFGKKRQRYTGDETYSAELQMLKRTKKESPVTTNKTFVVPSKMSFLRRRMRRARQLGKMAWRIQRKFVNRKSDTTTCSEGDNTFVIPNLSMSTYRASDVTTDADETLTLFERQLSTMERCIVSNEVTFWRSDDIYPSDTE